MPTSRWSHRRHSPINHYPRVVLSTRPSAPTFPEDAARLHKVRLRTSRQDLREGAGNVSFNRSTIGPFPEVLPVYCACSLRGPHTRFSPLAFPFKSLIHSTATCFSNQRKLVPINAPVNGAVHAQRTQAAYTDKCNRFYHESTICSLGKHACTGDCPKATPVGSLNSMSLFCHMEAN